MGNSQEQYIKSLKEIKELEEKTQHEIDSHNTFVHQEIKNLEEQLQTALLECENSGKSLVEKSIATAKENGIKEAEGIIEDAEIKSKTIKISSDKKTINEIIRMLISDF